MKILMISSRFPYPPIGGDKLKNYELIKLLSKNNELHFVSLIDRNLNNSDIIFCTKYFIDYKIFNKAKINYVFSALKFLFNDNPIQVNMYTFNDIKKYISKISNNYDLVLNTLIRTSEYVINNNIKNKKYLDITDSIAINYSNSIKNTKSLFWKFIYKIELNKLFKYEKKCIENYNYTFFVNKNESLFWSKYGNTIWIPNGVKDELFKYNKKLINFYNKSIIFFGKMDYQPNIDAVKWFIENVFNNINININFIVIGPNVKKKILKYKSNRIIITGYINDPYEIINSCLAVVAPMQTGGGIQNKILECMSLGKIVIATNLGADPIINNNNDNALIIANTKNDYINIINDIFNNYDKYKYIENNAKNFIKNNFTWSQYEEKLNSILKI